MRAGSAYVAGTTFSTDFPTTAGAVQTTYGGNDDSFIVKFDFVGPPARLTLSPSNATNPVNTQHCVTATVQDASANPTPNITVHFGVTGAITASDSATTDSGGQAGFCYGGPAIAGTDAITAYADTDNDSTRDVAEPSDAATKIWFVPLPTSADQCKNGGWQAFGVFKNQGDCVSFVATAGRNAPSQLP
ncbi:MAG: Ig-like domain-containing protein [Acidobacteria bacterium]|nr:Ig-like domain-containing protein [Acidobacteriota bacterium]